MMTKKTAQIERTFQDIPERQPLDIEQAAAMRDLGYDGGSTWDDLLKSPRVLIVSEAGAGKTHECRAQQQVKWDTGEPAFYLELAVLAKSNLRDMLGPEEETRLDAWLASQSDVATFFVDSIDELNLTAGSFQVALNKLAKALNGQFGRAHIVVTSRPIPIDQQIMQRTLPVPTRPDPEATSEEFANIAMSDRRQTVQVPGLRDWRNVALMPLSDEQMRQIALHEGVTDPDALLDVIRQRNAEEFARRPQDLIELCADWRNQKMVRTHRDQVASNIKVKLQPRKGDREPASLSFNEAFNGAARLALASALTRKLTLRHSAESDRHGPREEMPLDPTILLPDWSERKRATLLERSLFGFASYGRVRFHHRSVIEYLAAQHLKWLRSRGMTYRTLRRILFTETAQGKSVARPSMVPIAAWVALDDHIIFKDLLDHEPSALFNHGDPQSLTTEQRVLALRAYVAHYGGGGRRGMEVPGIQVTRFAGADLGNEIRTLWGNKVENVEVRSLLLNLAETGRNIECADIAHGVTCDTTLPDNERLDGLDVLIALGDPRLDSVCSSLADEPANWPDHLSPRAVVCLFPKHLSVVQMAKVLSRIIVNDRIVGDISYALPRIIEQADLCDQDLEELRQQLTNLVEEGLGWDEQKWPPLRTTRQFVAPALASTCIQLLNRKIQTPELLRSAIIARRVTDRQSGRCEHTDTLGKIFAGASSDLREAVVIADDTFLQSIKEETDVGERYYRIAFINGIIDLDPALDAEWLTATLSNSSSLTGQRAVALKALIRMRGDISWEDHLAALKPHVSDLPDLVTWLDNLPNPDEERANFEKWELENAKWRQEQDQRDREAHASWIAFWKEVAENPDSVLADDRAEVSIWNLWRVMERSGKDSRKSGWNRRFIERHFGKDTTDRIRLAFMKFWRGIRPTLRSERPDKEKDTYLNLWQLGLAAIYAEAEDPAWASKLTHEEVYLAMRYVPLQLNSFPAWLDALACAHPSAVTGVLGPELAAELPTSYSHTLQKVRGATKAIAAQFIHVLQHWLSGTWHHGTDQQQAAQHNQLRDALSILLHQDDATINASVQTLAEAELSAKPDGPFAPVWLSALIRLDPGAGVDALEQTLALVQPEKFGAGVKWFSSLFGSSFGTESVPLSTPGFTPALLLRLTRLVYHHVSPEQDMELRDGAYTPNIRDDAERARNAVLSALLNAEGKGGWEARLAMVKDPLFAHFKDRILTIAHQRAAEEADATIFDETQIVDLSKCHELAPMTRNDMFALMKDRLDDLEDELVRDESPRASWALIADETTMRQVIALRLRDKANGRYKVNQEAVTAEGKETDIRMASVASDQEAVIELKVGEKSRSAAELRAAIKNQLVTKYLAPNCRRAGCFMVTSNGEKSWRHPDTGAKLDLAGLMIMLNEECAQLEKLMDVRLVARGLDLSPRLPTEKAKP